MEGLAAMASRYTPLEKGSERRFARWVEEEGDLCLKLQDVTHWPDRLIVVDHGHCFFIEFKRSTKERLRPGQAEMIERLEEKGHHVYVCISAEQAWRRYMEEKQAARGYHHG